MTVDNVPHLRPLGLGELLDQAIRLYRNNFLKFIGIIAIVLIPLTLVQLFVSVFAFGDFLAQVNTFRDPTVPPPDDPFAIFGPSYFAGILGSCFLGILSFILLQGLATAALTRSVANSYLGKPTGIIESYQETRDIWVRLTLAIFFAIIMSIAMGIWWLIPIIGWFTGLGMIGFWSGVVMPLIAPIVVLESWTATYSINRAWNLVRQRFWWALGFMIILSFFGQLVVSGPTLVVTYTFQFMAGTSGVPFEDSSIFVIQTVIQTLVSLVFSLIYLPLQLIGATLLYFDLRVRFEGLDLDILASTNMGYVPDTTDLTTQSVTSDPGRLNVTMKEMGYFALITLAGIGLYIALVAIVAGITFAFVSAAGGF